MKKFLHPRILPILVPASGLLAMLLRIWTLGTGPDKDGLYAPQPLAWILLWVLTGLTLLAALLIPRRLKNPGRYADNFPASVPGAIGSGLAALAITFAGLQLLFAPAGTLAIITGVLGVLSGICLMIAALSRFQGQKPHFFLHAFPCLYFALRIFDCCRIWSNEPQLSTFLFPFFASICVMLASYQLASYDVNMGKRRQSLFWSLAGVYFCMLSLIGSSEPLFYGAMAIWLTTNLCSLRPLGKRKPEEAPLQDSGAEAAPAEESPAEEVPVEAAPAGEAEEKPATDMSMDELMDWLETK